jgi:predicted TIM-barrel fold metal-dependent hydrolase
MDFLEAARKLYYDTVLYTADALDLLLKTMGTDRCLFGAECPGVGSTIDPSTGRTLDDVRPMIESIEWLTAAQKQAIYEGNARRFFGLKSDG